MPPPATKYGVARVVAVRAVIDEEEAPLEAYAFAQTLFSVEVPIALSRQRGFNARLQFLFVYAGRWMATGIRFGPKARLKAS